MGGGLVFKLLMDDVDLGNAKIILTQMYVNDNTLGKLAKYFNDVPYIEYFKVPMYFVVPDRLLVYRTSKLRDFENLFNLVSLKQLMVTSKWFAGCKYADVLAKHRGKIVVIESLNEVLATLSEDTKLALYKWANGDRVNRIFDCCIGRHVPTWDWEEIANEYYAVLNRHLC
jgi:hypothetical protein